MPQPARIYFRLTTAICAAALTAGCAIPMVFNDSPGNDGDNVSGRDVEHAIDTKLAPSLKSADSNLKIAPARCAKRLNLSKGKTGYCTLPVDGVKLPVRVVYVDADPQGVRANFDGDFLETSAMDSAVAQQLKLYDGITASVRCPGPPVRVLKQGVYITCPIEGSTRITTVLLKTVGDGKVYVYPPTHLSPAISQFPGNAFAKHNQDEPVILTGPQLDAYLNRFYLPTLHMDRPGTVACPSTVDLSGENHVICAIHWQGNLTQHIDMFLVTDNYAVYRQEAVIDRRHVEQAVEQELDRESVDQGDPADAKVDCGPGLKVVAVRARFNCPATAYGDSYTIIVTVLNANGLVSWYALRN